LRILVLNEFRYKRNLVFSTSLPVGRLLPAATPTGQIAQSSFAVAGLCQRYMMICAYKPDFHTLNGLSSWPYLKIQYR